MPKPSCRAGETDRFKSRHFKDVKNILAGAQQKAQDLSKGGDNNRHHAASKECTRDKLRDHPRDDRQSELHSQPRARNEPEENGELKSMMQGALIERMKRDEKIPEAPANDYSHGASPGTRKRQRTKESDREQQKKRRLSPIHDTTFTQTKPHKEHAETPVEKTNETKKKHTKNAAEIRARKSERPTKREETREHRGVDAATKDEQVPPNLPKSKIEQQNKAEKPDRGAEISSKQLGVMQLSAAKTSSSQSTVRKGNGTITASKQLDIMVESVVRTPSKRLEVAEDDVMKKFSTLPSPPSSNGSSLGQKRPIAEVEEPEEHAPKKQRPTPDRARLPTPDHTGERPIIKQMKMVSNPKLLPKRPQRLRHKPPHTFAPVVPNPECKHAYAEYDDESVPILQSTLIKRHGPSTSLLNDPSIELKVEALMLLERGFKAYDLGRSNVPKSGATKIIEDCDLYLRKGKIYVATELGLLLAADYLKLAGISDMTPVRFHGVKPAWSKALLAQRYVRRVEVTTEDEERLETEEPLPPLPPGALGLKIGYVVEVYGRHPNNVEAYGRRLDTGKVGWFDYGHTAALDAGYTPWEGVFSPEQLMSLPVTASPAPIARSSPRPMRSPASAPAQATSAPALVTVAVAKEVTTVAAETIGKSDSADTVASPAAEVGDQLQKTHDVEITKTVVENTTVALAHSEAESAAKDQRGSTGSIEEAQAPVTSQPEDPRETNDEVTIKQEVGPHAVTLTKKDEVAPAKGHVSSGQCTLYDRSIEDEVDWDDDEL